MVLKVEQTEQAAAERQELTERQRRAAELFLMGRRVEDVAKELRVNRTTVWRWRRDPKFRRYLHDLRWDRNRAWGNKMDHLIELAAVEVEKAILAGDLKAAMEVFKRIPQYIPEDPSSLSPD